MSKLMNLEDAQELRTNILNVDTKGYAQAKVTGAATTITDSNLTTNRALVSDSSGKVAVSSITSTKLGYLTDVTSNIQTQLNNRIVNPNGVDTVNMSDWHPTRDWGLNQLAVKLKFRWITIQLQDNTVDNGQMRLNCGPIYISDGSRYFYTQATYVTQGNLFVYCVELDPLDIETPTISVYRSCFLSTSAQSSGTRKWMTGTECVFRILYW